MGKNSFQNNFIIISNNKQLLPGPSKTHPIEVAKPDSGGEGYRVMLFNDESHQMDEVVLQLVKALRCCIEDAVEIMLKVHTCGQAVVIISSRSEAERVAGILREIALKVRVDKI
jgi:ATP-dependent Clp protease adapter protein ClpS